MCVCCSLEQKPAATWPLVEPVWDPCSNGWGHIKLILIMLQLLSNNRISPKSDIKLQRTHLINSSSSVWQPDIADKWRNRWIYNSCWAMCCSGDRPLKRKSVTSIQSPWYLQWSQALKQPQVAFVKSGETRGKEEEIVAKENEMKHAKERKVLTNSMLVEQNAK